MIARRGIAAGLLAATAACGEPTAPYPPAESAAAQWATWVLPRADALRPAVPLADGTALWQQELDTVLAVQRARTAVSDSLVAHYDGDPTSRWTREAVDLLGFYWFLLPDVRIATPARSARLMALLHVAMYDAVVATWDAKWQYRRRAPARAGAGVRALVPLGDLPSYPSEHAAVAAAAREILAAAALPGDTARLRAMMREAGASRVAAGAAWPSDVAAGFALGSEVGRRVLQHAASDGAEAVWTGHAPGGALSWRPTPPRRVAVPFDALAGGWRPWVIPTGDAFRPSPHPLPGSPAWNASMDELLRLGGGARTVQQADRARYWATEAPTARWDLFVEDEISARRLSTPRAARARAYVSVAMYDAFIACWDAKYHYWLLRPVSVDPEVNPVFSTPPFPSYPSGHSTISTAAAEVLVELFPDKRQAFHAMAVEASNSRVWGGVHFRFDIEAGDTLGRKVGEAVVARMRRDGAQ